MTVRFPYRKYTAVQRVMSDAEVIQAYQGGLDAGSVGYLAGISSATVLNILKAAGIPRRKRGGVTGTRLKLKVPPQVIGQRYLAGESGVSLAASLGVHQRTIYNVLKELGIPRRHPLTELRRINRSKRQARETQNPRIAAKPDKSTNG